MIDLIASIFFILFTNDPRYIVTLHTHISKLYSTSDRDNKNRASLLSYLDKNFASCLHFNFLYKTDYSHEYILFDFVSM